MINKADINYVDLKFSFCGTPTNDLEMAFGTDANTNGVLDAVEVETRFGWRGGRYFIENALTCESFDSEAIAGSQNISVELHLNPTSNDRNLEWDCRHNLCPHTKDIGEPRP